MKAVTVACEGVPVSDNVKVVDNWDVPTPRDFDVVVKTEASALNHLDLWVGRGMPGLNLGYPRISGSDGCGIVTAVGKNVDETWLGKRVLLNAAVRQIEQTPDDMTSAGPEIRMIGEHDQGTNAEYFSAPVTNVLEVGAVDPVEAAAFGLSHLTAWRMLVTRAGLQAGQTVLLTGIGGGTALAAFNICKHFDCRIIVTSRHQWKLDRAIDLGADASILDTGEDWSRTVRELTQKRGVDLCVDSIGGPVHVPVIKSLARGGILTTCGCTAGSSPKTDLARIFWNQLTVVGSTMGDMDEFRAAVSLLQDGMKPVIDSVHEASDARAAFERLESGDHFGKVVLRWNEPNHNQIIQ